MSTLSISPIEFENNITRRESWLQRQTAKWKKDVAFVLQQIRALTLLLRHPTYRGMPSWLRRVL